MRYVVKFRGDLVAEAPSLVAGYMRIREEFKQRWPRAIYGSQEAAAHGFTLEGTPELTPEEARALRADLRAPREPCSIAAALRPGRFE